MNRVESETENHLEYRFKVIFFLGKSMQGSDLGTWTFSGTFSSYALHTNSNKLLDKTKINIYKTNVTDDRKSSWVLFDFLQKRRIYLVLHAEIYQQCNML